jgi:fatty-acid desaturase
LDPVAPGIDETPDETLVSPLPGERHGKLKLPETVRAPLPASQRIGIRWTYTISIAAVHLLALAAALPWFFSWTGVIACVVGLYIFGTLGVNVCFHRLLTHRSFSCPVWLEKSLAILGVCSLQEGPARWVSIHRQHHQHSDDRPDPHSPLVEFFWGHVGWLLVNNSATDTMDLYQKYARDLMKQRFYFNLERRLNWLLVYVAHAVVIAAATLLIARAVTGDWNEAWRLTASMVVWGVLLRTVLVWHITWSVNSLSHLFGYQSHDTGDNSRNNWFVALISNGEGWHNNHHADPRSAAHGHAWYEFDVSYLTILAMEKLGLATKVMRHDRNH